MAENLPENMWMFMPRSYRVFSAIAPFWLACALSRPPPSPKGGRGRGWMILWNDRSHQCHRRDHIASKPATAAIRACSFKFMLVLDSVWNTFSTLLPESQRTENRVQGPGDLMLPGWDCCWSSFNFYRPRALIAHAHTIKARQSRWEVRDDAWFPGLPVISCLDIKLDRRGERRRGGPPSHDFVWLNN